MTTPTTLTPRESKTMISPFRRMLSDAFNTLDSNDFLSSFDNFDFKLNNYYFKEEDDHYLLMIPVPGVKKENSNEVFNVEQTNDSIKVEIDTKEYSPVEQKKTLNFSLDYFNISTDSDIKASYDDGLLTLKITPKQPKKSKIEIN